jgi:hypothetical protein
LQAGRILVRHDDPGRDDGEAVLGVVGGVAHEEDEAMAHGLGLSEARPHQRPADALAAPRRVDRERTQEERRPLAQPDRPVADGAHEFARLARDEAEFLERGDAVTIAVGGLLEAVGPEGEVEQGLDGGPVERAFGGDREH